MIHCFARLGVKSISLGSGAMVRRQYSERHRQQRSKNLALLAALLALVLLFYLVFMARVGGL